MPLQEHEIPTVVVLNELGELQRDISTNTIYNTTDSGTVDVFTDFSLYEIGYSDLIDTLIGINTANVNETVSNIVNEIKTNLLNVLDKETLVSILIALKNSNSYDLETELFFNNYLQKAISEIPVNFRINIGSIPAIYETEVEMYISGTTYNNCITNIYCSAHNTFSGINTDIAQGSGRLVRLDVDLYSSELNVQNLVTDIFNSTINTENMEAELTTISGRLVNVETSIFSTAVDTTGTTEVDFKLRSLFTGNFFLEQDRFTTASSIAWVDIVDYLYPINTDNTHFYVEGVLASGVYFEDIPNGKRMYYNPLDDFYSDGVLTYSIHTENIIGEVEEKDFYLLFGYNLQVDEVIDWGANNKVVVRVEAQNLVFCPNLEGEAFDFTTVDLKSFNLNCTIRPVGFVDLPIQIFPQSAVFFYGKTYTVKLQNVKDFAGNVMPDFEYTFTIEDPLT